MGKCGLLTFINLAKLFPSIMNGSHKLQYIGRTHDFVTKRHYRYYIIMDILAYFYVPQYFGITVIIINATRFYYLMC